MQMIAQARDLAVPIESLARLDLAITELRRFWHTRNVRAQFLDRLGESTREMAVYRVLKAVDALGIESPSIADIADALQIEQSTASRLVNRSVVRGLVRRDASEADGRRVVLAVTNAGRAQLERMRLVRQEILSAFVEGWSAEDVETLTRLLERLSGSSAMAR